MPNTRLSPLLSVRRGAQAIAFYKEAFGAKEVFKLEAPDGAVVARLSIGSTEFWLSDESPEHGNYSPETLKGGTVRLILEVDDPKALYDQAVRAGASEVRPVVEEHGWQLGRIQDPFGHHWEIGKELV